MAVWDPARHHCGVEAAVDMGGVTQLHGASSKSTEKSLLAQEGPAPPTIGDLGRGDIQESVTTYMAPSPIIAGPLLLATIRDRDWVRRTLCTHCR